MLKLSVLLLLLGMALSALADECAYGNLCASPAGHEYLKARGQELVEIDQNLAAMGVKSELKLEFDECVKKYEGAEKLAVIFCTDSDIVSFKQKFFDVDRRKLVTEEHKRK